MRLRHRAAAVAAGIVLLAGSAYAVATSDAFVRRIVRGVLGRTFSGPARVADASFTFRDGLVIRGIELRDPHDPVGPAAVRVAEIRAEFELGLDGSGPAVTQVTLLRPDVRVRRRPDGGHSISDLLQPVPADSDPTVWPPVVLIEGGTVTYDDAVLIGDGPVILTGVTARLEPKGDAWRIEVAGHSEDLGDLESVVFVSPTDDVTGHVDMPAVPLSQKLLRRLRIPGADAAAALPTSGTVKVHAEVALGRGHDPVVALSADLAGLVTQVSIPDHEAGPHPPDPIDVKVASGTAEYRGDEITLSDLELSLLGATVRCTRARVAGLGSAAGATIRGEVRVDGLELRDGVHRHLPGSARRVIDAFGFRAKASVRAAIDGPVAAPTIEVDAALSEGRVRYEGNLREDGTRRGFPWDVNDLAGTASFRGGSAITFAVDGRHGPAKVHAHGAYDWASGDEIPDVTVVAEDVPLDADIRAAFQDDAEKVFDRWGASGTAARIDVRVVRDPHDDGPFGEATEVTLHLDGRAGMQPKLLPLPLADIRGRIQVLYPSQGTHRSERVNLINVRARCEGIGIRVDGRVETDRAVASDDLVVEADISDVGGPVRDAVAASTEFIPESVKRLFDDLGPQGPAGVRAEVAGDPDRRRDVVILDLRGTSVRGYRDVPFAASELTGRVTVDGDEVRFEDIVGTALGVPIRGAGRLTGIATGPVEPDMEIGAIDLPLGDSLRRALGPIGDKAAAFWDRLGPVDAGAGDPPGGPAPESGSESRGGTEHGTRGDAIVTLRASTDATPVEIRLARIRGPLRPLGLGFVVRDGELHYDGREATMRLAAALGSADVHLRRAHYDVATRVLEADLDTVGLRFPEDVASLFSPETATGISEAFPGRVLDAEGLRLVYDPGPERLDLAGRLAIRPAEGGEDTAPGLAPSGALGLDRLTFWFPPGLPTTFDGSIRAEGVRVNPGLQIEDLSGLLGLVGRIDEDGVELVARTEGAQLTAVGLPLRDATIQATTGVGRPRVEVAATLHGGRLTARVGPGGPQVAYEGEVHLRGADLSKFAKTSDASGALSGDVVFRNTSGETDDLHGSVEITVKDGDLVRFPVVSSMLNLIPGAGKLTDGILSGSIQGRTLHVRDLVVRGPILSLSQGKGTVGFDGTLDLSLNPGIPLTSIAVTGTIRAPQASLRLLSTGK